MTGSWKGRGNQYIQFVRVLYCKLPTNGKQLPAFPLEAVLGIKPRPQRWEAANRSSDPRNDMTLDSVLNVTYSQECKFTSSISDIHSVWRGRETKSGPWME